MPKAAEQILALRRARQGAAWQLLAADSAPFVLGMLRAHLLEQERVGWNYAWPRIRHALP